MPVSISRRRFLGVAAGAAGALGAAALADGFLIEPGAVEITRHDVPVPGLAPDLAGLRVAAISDVHLAGGVHVAARASLAQLARERPGVVVLIGDICNQRSDLAHLVAWARDARGTRATFATLGNWEHEAGIDRATAERAYGSVGVELLYNSSGRVGPLTFVGIDDPVQGEPDLATAVRGVEADDPALWVLHGPGFVDGVPRAMFPHPAAIIAGHTHGGQIRLPVYTPHLPTGTRRFVAGRHRAPVGARS